MKLPSIKLGRNKDNATASKAKSPGEAKNKLKLDIRNRLKTSFKKAWRFQTTLIALAVVGLLALTALRMLHYTDPPVDENRVQENLAKFKQIRIDPKTVQKIQQLQNSGTSTGPNLENGRTNPFSE